jgi:hypothetical protein
LDTYPGGAYNECARWGHVAEWLRNGLQIAGGFTRVTHVRNSGSSKSFRHFGDFRFEVGVALIRYRSHFIAVTVAALPGVP